MAGSAADGCKRHVRLWGEPLTGIDRGIGSTDFGQPEDPRSGIVAQAQGHDGNQSGPGFRLAVTRGGGQTVTRWAEVAPASDLRWASGPVIA
ncbi:hypothetical protein [Rubellimicrobium arenae]|uniref:hypothetical protein n=1 Tax=Rubellimicrobium arenae TaxID=2817372 RepID=UPI001B31638E|nr:hypothetical protein [Rubellimicrobium arenae]